jgi:hypothetical protein
VNITRVFLDWARPALPAAVEWLIEQSSAAGQLDLGNVVLALPGARAGRRLLEILVAEAERRQLLLGPPRIVTAGKLPELLYEAKRPFADTLAQQLAWTEALRRADSSSVQRIVPTVPDNDDLLAWLSLGEMLARLHRELAADALDFPAVAQCGSGIEGFHETARWNALAEIQKLYLATLDGLGLWDRQTARLVAIRQGECRIDAEIVLIGTADLNRSQRLMLDQVADRVTALVFAPASMAARFDDHGCIAPAAWLLQEIPLSDQQMEVADNPVEQAEAVVRAIADFDGRYTTEQIAIGMADEPIVPFIEQRLRQCGLPARYGVGTPIARSAPYRLLAAAADYLETSSFTALAGLVRHPWIHDWLLAKNISGDFLTELDTYQGEHIPSVVDGRWPGDGTSIATVHRVYEAVESLCRPLDGKLRPIVDWAQPMLEILSAVFGRALLHNDVEPDRAILAACDEIRDSLAEHVAIPAELAPSVTGIEAIRLVLKQVAGASIPPPPEHGAIELLGWLELPLDDAPALIVTGFNEGCVPASLNGDVFLPNQLRRALGIEDNDRRYARDAYALSVLAASRETLHVIAGRRSADGDPLLPSRLLFSCDDASMANRVMKFFAGEDAPARAGIECGALRPGRERSLLEPPRPKPLANPVASMRVTEFKDYLGCPYRYYLRHVLKLEGLADSALELDGAGFGSLAHEVLSSLRDAPDVVAAKAETIAKYLDNQLGSAVQTRYGKSPLPAILVQVEQLRRRLAAFAAWQAAWAAQGWRIEHAEVSPEAGTAFLEVDGRKMLLRGRIDRIDIHEATGKRMLFDYKTSDRATTPEKAHRKRSGEWIDLQLPLYRHLVAGLGIQGEVGLAYIALPKDVSAVGHLAAEWTQADLDDADQAAAGVVRRVWNEEFLPATTPPPAFCEDLAAICQDNRFAVMVVNQPEEGAGNP